MKGTYFLLPMSFKALIIGSDFQNFEYLENKLLFKQLLLKFSKRIRTEINRISYILVKRQMKPNCGC